MPAKELLRELTVTSDHQSARREGGADVAGLAASGRVATRLPAIVFTLVACLAPCSWATAGGPLVPPGDPALRHDLQRLTDAGAIDLPLSAWPLSRPAIERALADVDPTRLDDSRLEAFHRLKERLWQEPRGSARFYLSASAAGNPRTIRTFEDTPREDGAVSGGLSWFGDRLAVNLEASFVADPFDDDEWRPDGSFLGLALGNWILSAGWQERWWGPGRDGSLILSTNARPAPGVGLQRDVSLPFESRWLRWIGPWTVTAFLNQLDDERVVDDALLFGLRVTFKPHESLEIGLSRSAQWCGEDRPCDFDAFTDLLFGNDNRGVNVDPNDEPGNQLAGIDMRWALPRDLPIALYMQWIGEDTRRGGPEIGSWLRQAGIEYWGTVSDLEYRAHFEVADSTCREGGFGFSDVKPDCGYEHGIYRTGYRYLGRAIGLGTDGDALTYSLGSTLIQSSGDTWNVSLRYMDLNRAGDIGLPHTITTVPRELVDAQVSHERLTRFGQLYIGVGASRLDDAGTSTTDVSGFVQWTIGSFL